MVTFFLVFIITKGALTLYEGNTIGRGAIRGGDTAQILESREKKWILIGLLRSVPEKSSLNLTLYIEIALVHSVCLLIIPNVKTPKKT